MPKNPILRRDAYFAYLHGSGIQGSSDPSNGAQIRQLDWNVVGTSIGDMVEPASLIFDAGHIVQDDANDQGFNSIRFDDDNTFSNNFGTGGQQVPVDYNVQ